jgi:NADPH:quinone reductase-like Zn-dependent oxidoreductase
MKLRYKILLGVAGLLVTGVAALAITLGYESPCVSGPALAADVPPMRALMQRCYGAPGVLRVENVAKTTPGGGQLLIKVHAAGLNPFEWHMTTGKPYLLRLFKGVGAPDSPRTGSDFAGTVEAVGAGVSRFKPGDQVFGGTAGALAEYVLASEQGDIVLKPAELTFEQAAAIPIAAVTALQALRDHGKLAARQKVLINGASGGVGTYAVQIAKALGAEVTGVCSTRNVDLVRSLGADHVIDYTREDFTQGAKRYDVIFDTAGNHGLLALRDSLQPQGILVGVGGSKREPWVGPLWSMGKRKLVAHFVEQKLVSFIANVNASDLEYLANLAREGKMKSVIDKRYSLEETGAALEYIATRRARGKVVVTLE